MYDHFEVAVPARRTTFAQSGHERRYGSKVYDDPVGRISSPSAFMMSKAGCEWLGPRADAAAVIAR